MIDIILSNYNWIFLAIAGIIMIVGATISVVFSMSKDFDTIIARTIQNTVYVQLVVWGIQLFIHVVRNA